jgi:chromosome segregation ATPase
MDKKIQALQEAAAKKAQAAHERVEQALERMVKQNQTINFQTVARSANVSTAYLYQSEKFKERIETLRDQQKNRSKPKKAPTASEDSKNVMINALRQETKRLRGEITELRRANEALAGRLYQVQTSNDLAERLKLENYSLKQQIQELSQRPQECESQLPQKVTPITQAKGSRRDLSEAVLNHLAAAGINLNPTLVKAIKAAPEETVIEAIKAYQEALATVNIEHPGGWLKKAIEEGWKPNDTVQAKSEMETFKEWFPLAQKKGIVLASQKSPKGMEVYLPEGGWIPFATMLKQYPIQTL